MYETAYIIRHLVELLLVLFSTEFACEVLKEFLLI